MLRTRLIVGLSAGVLLYSLTGAALAAELIPSLKTSRGTVYQDVKWGPVNAGKVVVFHTGGVAFVPLEELPEEYQGKFGYKAPSTEESPVPVPIKPIPSPTPLPKPLLPPRPSADLFKPVSPPSSQPGEENNSVEWKEYSREKNLKMMFEGKLVDKSGFTQLTGFAVGTGTLSQTDSDGKKTKIHFTTLKLARKKIDAAPSMQMRPGLWEATGEEVDLLNYRHTGDTDAVLIFYGKETEPVDERRTFLVGEELTFEQWRTLRKR